MHDGVVPRTCCQPDYDAVFDERAARRELAAYRRKGPTGHTRRLIEAVRARGIEGASVLDIGGGVGVIGAELLAAGAAGLTDVDASHAYVAAASAEIERRGFGPRATFHHGDFVELAASLPEADIVTLDRVICCYGGWKALIDASTGRSRRLLGLILPRETWWMRLIVVAGNLGLRLFRQSFRFYVHPEREMDARIRAAGFARRVHARGIVWQTLLYERVPAAA